MLCNTVFANRNHTGSEESAAKGENSSAQWACDEELTTNYVTTKKRESKRGVSRCFLGRCPQSSLSLASNYAVWLVSAHTLNRRRKRDVFAPNEEREIFLHRYRSQQNTIKAWGVSVFPPFVVCLLLLFSSPYEEFYSEMTHSPSER